MFRKFTLVMMVLLLSTAVNAQEEWVSFGSKSIGSPPEVSVNRSDNQEVTFTVSLAGMYVESKSEASGSYKRLSMPQCQVVGEVGSPEIPVFTKMVAIPECSDINVTVSMSGQQTFTGYTVYPVPSQEVRINDDKTVYLAEVFTKDASVYAQNVAMPADNYMVIDTGYMRAQRYLRLELHPVQYNPVTGLLSVATDMEVTMTFTNATTPVNANVGIFNNVLAKTMVNYADQGITAAINDKAFEKEGFVKGNVQYKRLTNWTQVQHITADYLIICADAFFPEDTPHDEVLRLANHRSFYNGFDVYILNVEDIISDNVGFSYEGYPYPEFKKEQRIRSCIREIYETGTAHHTLDGKLGYVLLVGDHPRTVSEKNGLPGSYDHPDRDFDEIEHPDYDPAWHIYASDYYYACVTGNYTPIGHHPIADVYIGRFCVPNNMDTVGLRPGLKFLRNIVTKTIKYETEYDDPQFKQRVNIGMGGGENFENAMYKRWSDYIWPHMQDPTGLNGVNAFNYANSAEFADKIKEMLNSMFIGGIFSMSAHGGVEHWWSPWPGMYAGPLGEALTNVHKHPFCMSASCLTGRFDDLGHAHCLAGYMTGYSDSLGFIGMLAASTLSALLAYPSDSYYGNLPVAVHRDLSFVTGEFVLETKLASYSDDALMYNLFGDPALNIMAEGFEVSKSTELKSDTTHISCKITVVKGGNLIISHDKTVLLDNKGNITVEKDGYLTMNNNSKITSFAEHSPDRFIKTETAGSIWVPVSAKANIENVNVITNNISRINFNNVIYTHSDTASYHAIYNCSFNNSIIKPCISTNTVSVSNSTFTDTEVTFNGSTATYSSALTFTNSDFVRSSLINNNYKMTSNKSTFTDSEITLKGSVYSNPLTVTTLTNSTFEGSPITHYNHKLVATGCDFLERSDVVVSYSIVDINNCDFWKSGFHSKLPMGIPQPEPYTPSVKITGSSFGNTGTYIIGYDKGEHPIYSSASIKLDGIKEFQITDNVIMNVNAAAPKGVGPGDPPIQEVPQGEGIYLNNAGQGTIDNRLISGNDISQCETGLYVYGSKATLKYNDIHNNIFGVRLFNNSSVSLVGDPNIANGQQFIRDNSSYEIYASNNALPNPFIYNQIIDEDNKGNSQNDPLLYYDVLTRGDVGPGGGTQPIPINISCNYWGDNFVHNDDIYPANRFITSPIWDPQTGDCTSKGKELYEDGIEYFADEDYLAAKAAFTELIETYPDDQFSIAALHELFALEQFLDNDYAALHDYYAAFTPTDSTLFDVADFLATRCNVTLQNWQLAIDWYENRIENSPSYQDSIFAVIDLGDIHLSMEADSTNLKSGRIGYGRFLNLVPKSRREYEENKAELLATLPKMDDPRQQHPLAEPGKKGVLRQNIPNPATGSTTVVYDVVEEGAVELRLYNQLGQLLQALPQGTQKPGSYRIEISLAGLPSAMYHYILFVEGEKADAKKLIVN